MIFVDVDRLIWLITRKSGGTTVNTVTNYRVPLEIGKFATISFSRRILLHDSHYFLVRYCICGLQKSGTRAVVGYSEFIRRRQEKQRKINHRMR